MYKLVPVYFRNQVQWAIFWKDKHFQNGLKIETKLQYTSNHRTASVAKYDPPIFLPTTTTTKGTKSRWSYSEVLLNLQGTDNILN